MADEAGKESTGSVRCSCGVQIPVPSDAVGRDQTCPSCSAPFKAVWAVDAKTRAKVLTRVAGKGNALRIPPGSHQLNCACGQVLVARKEQAGKRVKCPVCGASMVIEKYKDPLTLETKVRREDRKETRKRTDGTAVVAARSLGRTTRRRKAPDGAQDILCQCGEYLRVVAEHLDKKVLCPSCGTLMKMERSGDSNTTVRPRIVGKSELPPPVDPDDWSLSDFR